MFQNAILENYVFELDAAMKQYSHAITADPNFVIYDCSDLPTARNQAMQIRNSISLPPSPPSALLNSLPIVCQFQTPQTGHQ